MIYRSIIQGHVFGYLGHDTYICINCKVTCDPRNPFEECRVSTNLTCDLEILKEKIQSVQDLIKASEADIYGNGTINTSDISDALK